ASELLKRIAAEKAELVKQGKIKKQKPLPGISEEEKPFELPEGWERARINDIASFTNGYAFKSSEFQNSGVGIVKIGDIDSSGFISTAGMS
ncbi:restriction endonuclease subunit S, partial [Escherichia coli]|nr:restriction endonuclease subunit S [Escherichia coli]